MAKNLKTLLPASVSSVGSPEDMPDRCIWTYYPQANAGAAGTNIASYYGGEDAYGTEVWTVPTGVNKAKFELWSGGGAGAGARCCSWGVNGGTGAYAYKEIDVTPGDVYRVCAVCLCKHFCCNIGVGSSGCNDVSDNANFFYGQKGACAYITGNGLTNFCATGGNPGIALARWWINSTAYACMIEYSCQPGPNRAKSDAHHTSSSTLTRNMCYTMRDMLWCYTCSKSEDIDDSDNSPWNRACYYGADGGHRGIYSYIRFSCCGHRSASSDVAECGHHDTYTYPPGLWTHPDRSMCGGHVEVLDMGQCFCFNTPHSGGDICRFKSYMDHGQSSMNYLQASGGKTARTTAGNCCCGAPGGAPLFRITYC